MYGVFKPLVKETILEYVSEWDIFKKYIPSLHSPDCSFVSELRDENNASCRVTMYNGRYWYKDFGDHQGPTDCFSYVQRAFNENFNESLKRIVLDFNLNKVIDASGTTYHNERLLQPRNSRIPSTKKKPTVITIVERSWQLLDKMYWFDRYGITQTYLNAVNIKPITRFTIINDKFPAGFTMDGQLHCYSLEYYMNGIFRRKIYQPFSYRKWLSNVDNTVVQGIKVLPPGGGKVLFITSSLKDAGAITCNTGIYAIAPNNESSFIPVEVFNKLRKKWDHIILWFDNDYLKEDNPGLMFSKIISEKYDLPYVLTPDGMTKDPSDFIYKFGRDSFRQLTEKLLRRNNINYEIKDFNCFR